MAEVQSKIYRFVPSGSPDVRKYILYYGMRPEEGPDHEFAYNQPEQVDLGMPETETYDVDGTPTEVMRVDLAQVFPSTTDGFYDLAVTAQDEAGNLSSFGGVVRAVPLDFEAPDAPGAGFVAE